jgi:hypothetical protein
LDTIFSWHLLGSSSTQRRTSESSESVAGPKEAFGEVGFDRAIFTYAGISVPAVQINQKLLIESFRGWQSEPKKLSRI